MYRGTINQFQTLKSRQTVHDEHFDAKIKGDDCKGWVNGVAAVALGVNKEATILNHFQ